MLFSRVKISSFCVKAHLVFHWWLYNKTVYHLDNSMTIKWCWLAYVEQCCAGVEGFNERVCVKRFFPFTLLLFPSLFVLSPWNTWSVQLDVSLHEQSPSSIMRLCVFSHVTIVNGFLSSLDCTKLGHFSVCERSKQIPPQTLSDKILLVEQWTLKRQ